MDSRQFDGRRGPGQIARRWFSDVPGTSAISTVIVAVWLVCAVQSGSVMNTGRGGLAESWMLWGGDFSAGLRPLSALGFQFIHLDASHMGVNVFMALLIGREIERAYGTGVFVATWLISGFGSALAVLVFDPLTPTAGASGALYGLMAVLVGLAVASQADLRAPLILVAVNLGYTFLSGSVSLWGHVGGLVTGAVIAVVLVALPRRFRGLGLGVVGAAVVAGLVGFYLNGPVVL